MDAECARSFVEDTFRRAYGAHGASTFGEYLSSAGPGRAALGHRRAGAGPLFLEAYLGLANKARDILAKAYSINPKAEDGGAAMSLGVLSDKVPGSPIGFVMAGVVK